MFCIHCAEAIPDDSSICPCCGENPRMHIADKEQVSEKTPGSASTEAGGSTNAEAKPAFATNHPSAPTLGPSNSKYEEHSSLRQDLNSSENAGTLHDSGEMESDESVVYASQIDKTEAAISGNMSVMQKVPKLAWLGAAVVVAIIAIVLAVGAIGKSSLKSDLVGTWYDTDGSIIKVLEIKDSTMTYKLETGYSYLDSTVDTWQWRPTGANSFEVNMTGNTWTKHTIEFGPEKAGFTVEPALTNTDSQELWVDIS